MSIRWMGRDMARRFDPLFPETGGLEHMADVYLKFRERVKDGKEKDRPTFLYPEEVEHVRKALRLLGDDEEAKATIMSVLTFAQKKDDRSGW